MPERFDIIVYKRRYINTLPSFPFLVNLRQLVTVVGSQFITLSVHLCVQHDGREAARCAGLSAVPESLV